MACAGVVVYEYWYIHCLASTQLTFIKKFEKLQ